MRNCENGKTPRRSQRTPFLKFYVDDWGSGTRSLTLEEKGFYFECLLRMWEQKSGLSNDDKDLACSLHCNPRTVRKLRGQLLAKGKLKIVGGLLVNRRMMNDIQDFQLRVNSTGIEPEFELNSTGIHAELELNDHETSNENNETDAKANSPRSQKPEARLQKEKKTPLPPKGAGATPTDALKAFEAYNATALQCGLPQAAKLTPDRQRKIIARLKDYGLDGWAQALGNIEKSSFLTGGSTNGFRADLNFMLQAKSFGKLHDGSYGNGRHTATSELTAEQLTLKARYDAILAEGVPS